MSVAGIGQALKAYGVAARRAEGPGETAGLAVGSAPGSDFAAVLRGAGSELRAGEAKAVEALSGRASLQDVVEAVSEAELSLQKMTAIRDRVISAYQEIMRMPI